MRAGDDLLSLFLGFLVGTLYGAGVAAVYFLSVVHS